MIRFGSDYHLYDGYSVDWRKQPHMTLDDIAHMILDIHNSVVRRSDTTVIVGDIGAVCDHTLDIFSQMNGELYLVLGNHDHDWDLSILKNSGVFKHISDNILFDRIYVQHTPDFVFSEEQRNYFYYIHGHHHVYNTLEMRKEFDKYKRDNCRYNCCIDLNNLKPCTLQELMLNKAVLVDKLQDTV